MFTIKHDDGPLLKAFLPVRVSYFIDKKGEVHYEEAICFNSRVFNPKGIEKEYFEHKAPRAEYNGAPAGFWRLEDLTPGQLERLVEAYEASRRSHTPGDYKEQSRRRAVKRMRGYALANEHLDLFVTLTLSPEKVERTDYASTIRRVSQWLDNRVRRDGLCYLLVPELHADGGIHFHGFFNRSAVRLENSGLKRDEKGNFRAAVEPNRKGKVVYNLPDFDLGFTTALRLGKSWGDRQKAVAYCLKYMSKGAEKVGGRWYLHCGALQTRQYAYYDYGEPDRWRETFDDIDATEISITDGLKCKIIDGAELDGAGDFWKKLTVSRQ